MTRFRVQIEQDGVRWWESWQQETTDPEACALRKVAAYNAKRGPMDPERRVLTVRVRKNRHPRQTPLPLSLSA